jgi:hypothetical protein
MVLTSLEDKRKVGELAVTFPEEEGLVLEGPIDGQQVRMSFRRPRPVKKDYLLRSRGFRWVQEVPFNR